MDWPRERRVLTEVLDQQLQVPTQHLHRYAAAVRVPKLRIAELLSDFGCPVLTELLRHRRFARFRDAPLLELVAHEPLFQQRDRELALVLVLIQLRWIKVRTVTWPTFDARGQEVGDFACRSWSDVSGTRTDRCVEHQRFDVEQDAPHDRRQLARLYVQPRGLRVDSRLRAHDDRAAFAQVERVVYEQPACDSA